MKLSTFGVWNQPRIKLMVSLKTDPNLGCTRKQIKNALFQEVLITIIETISIHYESLSQNQELSLQQKVLAAHEQSFATVLSTLSKALGKSEALLKEPVKTFVSECMTITNNHIDSLIQLAEISKKAKTEVMEELYGHEFSKRYPKLAVTLPFNDLDLTIKAKYRVLKTIRKKYPEEVYPLIKEHSKFMHEITEKKMLSPAFANEFKQLTGLSMAKFKKRVGLEQEKILSMFFSELSREEEAIQRQLLPLSNS